MTDQLKTNKISLDFRYTAARQLSLTTGRPNLSKFVRLWKACSNILP